MRISSSLFFQMGLDSINAQQSDLMHLFQQVGSGQRILTPADDPLGAAQAINIRQSQTMNQRYAENRDVAMRNLGVEENTLSGVVLLLEDIKTRLIEAGNGTMSDIDRMTLANVLRHSRTTLLGLANATDGNGQYIFSGSKGDVMPFHEVSGDYMGDTSQRHIQVDQTRRIAGADTGIDVFFRATPGVSSYLTAEGSGTSFGAGPVNDGTGVIGTAAVYDATQVQPGYRFDLSFDGTDSYVITVYDEAGAIVDPLEHPAVPDWTVPQSFNPDTEQLIQLPFGVQVKLAGSPANGDTFSVVPAAGHDLNIFHTLDVMISALEQPFDADPAARAYFLNALASSIQRLDINYDNVLTVRASVGARFQEIDALNANGGLRNLGYRNQLSSLEDLDYYAASAQLELRKSALEAAALAFRKIQATTLFGMNAGG